MNPPLLTRVRRLLRSPWTITAELASVALAGVAATLVDQHPTAGERARRLVAHPLGGRVVDLLGLDRIFTSGWFLAAVGVSAASLALVAWEQWRRGAREWRIPDEARFRAAPFRRTFSRPARGAGRRVRITSRGRVALLGAPLFHTGLLVVMLAGIVRMLLGADAARALHEGGRLEVGAGAFETQERGWLAGPVALPAEVRLLRLHPTYHPSGELRELAADVTVGGAPAESRVAVNAPLQIGATRLYLTSSLGAAALVDVALATSSPQDPAATPGTAAALLLPEGGDYAFAGPLPDGSELRLRAPLQPGAERPPPWVEARVLSDGVLRAAGRLQPGAALALPGGGSLTLREVRWWVRVVASRDPSTWPVYVGLAVTVLGVLLLFGVTRVDTLVVAESRGDTEEVLVALRPGAHAPAYAEAFELLVEREAGGG